MVDIRRLSSYSFDEAVQLWNRGFDGYFVDMTLTVEQYLGRIHGDGISPRHSLVAVSDGKPCGFLLTAIRNQQAWNGGTGVDPEFRGKGIGKALVRAVIELYCEQKVTLASLEVIETNHAAIKLYQQFGYQTVDQLVLWRCDERVRGDSVTGGYSLSRVGPVEVSRLSFYRHDASWQTQWQSVTAKAGEGLLVKDSAGTDMGYALFSRTFDAEGSLTAITLFQCEIAPECDEPVQVARVALRHVFSPFDIECRRITSNLRKSNDVVIGVLQEMGFTLFVEQRHMIRDPSLECGDYGAALLQ